MLPIRNIGTCFFVAKNVLRNISKSWKITSDLCIFGLIKNMMARTLCLHKLNLALISRNKRALVLTKNKRKEKPIIKFVQINNLLKRLDSDYACDFTCPCKNPNEFNYLGPIEKRLIKFNVSVPFKRLIKNNSYSTTVDKPAAVRKQKRKRRHMNYDHNDHTYPQKYCICPYHTLKNSATSSCFKETCAKCAFLGKSSDTRFYKCYALCKCDKTCCIKQFCKACVGKSECVFNRIMDWSP